MKHYKIKQSITDRSSISVNLYLKEISKYPLLTPDEEIQLVQQAKSGDKLAKEKLINSNLRFVISIAKQYQNKGLEFADLIAYGNIGLMKAVDLFDEKRGFKFVSYAVWWIRQSILQALVDYGKTIKLPSNQVILLNKINQYILNFNQLNERNPSIDEIADHFELEYEKVQDILSNSMLFSSLDLPVSDDSEECLSDTLPTTISSDKTLSDDSLAKDLNFLFLNLNPTEILVLKKYFGIEYNEMSLEQISSELNITKERVRQIKDKAILKLRKSNQISKLFKYLG